MYRMTFLSVPSALHITSVTPWRHHDKIWGLWGSQKGYFKCGELTPALLVLVLCNIILPLPLEAISKRKLLPSSSLQVQHPQQAHYKMKTCFHSLCSHCHLVEPAPTEAFLFLLCHSSCNKLTSFLFYTNITVRLHHTCTLRGKLFAT